MKTSAIRSLATAALFGAVSVGFSQGESSALRADVQKLFRSMDAALGARDVAKLRAMFHPAFVSVDAQGGKMNWPQVRSNLDHIKDMKDVTCKTTVVHVAGDNTEATVWISMSASLKMNQNGKWTALKMTRRYAETLRKGADGWKFFYEQELPMNEPWPF